MKTNRCSNPPVSGLSLCGSSIQLHDGQNLSIFPNGLVKLEKPNSGLYNSSSTKKYMSLAAPELQDPGTSSPKPERVKLQTCHFVVSMKIDNYGVCKHRNKYRVKYKIRRWDERIKRQRLIKDTSTGCFDSKHEAGWHYDRLLIQKKASGNLNHPLTLTVREACDVKTAGKSTAPSWSCCLAQGEKLVIKKLFTSFKDEAIFQWGKVKYKDFEGYVLLNNFVEYEHLMSDEYKRKIECQFAISDVKLEKKIPNGYTRDSFAANNQPTYGRQSRRPIRIEAPVVRPSPSFIRAPVPMGNTLSLSPPPPELQVTNGKKIAGSTTTNGLQTTPLVNQFSRTDFAKYEDRTINPRYYQKLSETDNFLSTVIKQPNMNGTINIHLHQQSTPKNNNELFDLSRPQDVGSHSMRFCPYPVNTSGISGDMNLRARDRHPVAFPVISHTSSFPRTRPYVRATTRRPLQQPTTLPVSTVAPTPPMLTPSAPAALNLSMITMQNCSQVNNFRQDPSSIVAPVVDMDDNFFSMVSSPATNNTFTLNAIYDITQAVVILHLFDYTVVDHCPIPYVD